MKIGMMNNPAFPLRQELEFVISNRFDFLDFTLEPPEAVPTVQDAVNMGKILYNEGINVIGHTAFYLPVDSPFQRVRESSVQEIVSQLDVFKAMGADKVTIHAAFSYPHRFFKFQTKLNFWKEALSQILDIAKDRGIQIILENTAGHNDCYKILRDLLKAFPDIGFHLDIGHANLDLPTTSVYEYLRKFKKRLVHIHLSDNFSRGHDLHLPIGAGGIPWKHVLKLIKESGYDETFTLEVFSYRREYLLESREILRTLWQEI